MSDYGFTVEVPEGYDEAVLRARLAMKGEGFSIISEMHVGGMLGPDAGDQRQYLIMGMWNAALSERHIDPQLKAAVHLPCNVVVQEVEGGAIVAALDPVDVVESADAASMSAASVARGAVERMLQTVATGPAT
jgi:uncharacterized protein (DUF302 family)